MVNSPLIRPYFLGGGSFGGGTLGSHDNMLNQNPFRGDQTFFGGGSNCGGISFKNPETNEGLGVGTSFHDRVISSYFVHKGFCINSFMCGDTLF